MRAKLRTRLAAMVVVLATGLGSEASAMPPGTAAEPFATSNAARWIETWAGRDAVLHRERAELSFGPGVSYHQLVATRGPAAMQAWGAGGHVELSLLLSPAHHPIVVQVDGAVFSKHALSDRVLRATLGLTFRFP